MKPQTACRKSSSVIRILLLVLPISILVAILDQWSKHYVESHFELHEILPVIDGFFNLTLTYNPGAAFGLFAGLSDEIRPLILWSVSSVALLAILYFLFVEYRSYRLAQVFLALILGGAIGNGIDRATRGKVVDFLDFYLGSYHWPAFNIADSAISVGAVFLIIVSLRSSSPVRRDREEDTATSEKQSC